MKITIIPEKADYISKISERISVKGFISIPFTSDLEVLRK